MNDYYGDISQSHNYDFTGKDGIISWVSLLVGYLAMRALPVEKKPFGAFIFVAALWTMAIVLVKISDIRPGKTVRVISAASILLAPSFLVTSGIFTTWTLYFGEVLAYLYCLCTLGSDRRNDSDLIYDAVNSVFKYPLGDFTAQPKAAFSGKGNGKKIMKSLLYALLGLCAAIVPTLIVVLLLSFDQNFTNIIDHIFDLNIEWFTSRLTALIFAVPTAMYLFGALYSAKIRYKNEENGSIEEKKSIAFLPAMTSFAVLTPLLAVYVIFFISQWDIYMSAFTGKLPEGFVYSSYAREGFFQLCAVAGINALILICVHLLTKSETRLIRAALKIYTVTTSLFTLVLIATAMSKMVLYIKSYGLTLKRIDASWLMIVLAVAFVFVIIKQFVPKLDLTYSVAISTLLLFACLAYSNPCRIVADYNTNAYLDGKTDSIDIEELYDMGYPGVTSLYRIYMEGDDEKVKNNARNRLSAIKKDLKKDDTGLLGFSVSRIRASRVLDNIE